MTRDCAVVGCPERGKIALNGMDVVGVALEDDGQMALTDVAVWLCQRHVSDVSHHRARTTRVQTALTEGRDES